MREYGAVNIYVMDYCEINTRRKNWYRSMPAYIRHKSYSPTHSHPVFEEMIFRFKFNITLLFVWYTIRSTKLVWQLTASSTETKCWACIRNSREEEKIATNIEKLLISLYFAAPPENSAQGFSILKRNYLILFFYLILWSLSFG